MANLRPRFLQSLLVSALLISTTPALALQTIDARDGVSVEASIALKEATRIKVDGERITEVFGNIYSSNCGGVASVNRDTGQSLAAINPAGEVVLECDKDKGEIYVKPVSAGGKPINLFISTAKSTYTLILKRVDMPADTIVLKDRVLQQAATRLERSGGTSPSHVRLDRVSLHDAAPLRKPRLDRREIPPHQYQQRADGARRAGVRSRARRRRRRLDREP